MKKLIALLSAFCLAANAGPLTLHIDRYIPNFSAPNITNVNLVVITVSNAAAGATDTLLTSIDMTNWTPIVQVIAPGQIYSTGALMPLSVTNGFFKLMESKP